MVTLMDDFLRNVLASGLIPREQLQELLRALPRDQREQPEQVAGFLVRQGVLTPFQAQKLLHGVTAGLAIGPYQIEAPLGKGGMGMVYLALDSRNRQHVALKILSPRKARLEERYLARFRREMELSQRVFHPHIALTLEAGTARNIHYIALEYIPGQTLYRLVSSEGPLKVPRAARLFMEIASALAHAHAAGLIHRDLKPSNIMVTPHDHAKVLDLGLAFMVGDEAAEDVANGGKQSVVGSIDYMAPEQTRDARNVDARSDIYSLGCCLYFALTGKPPFPGGSLRDKMHAHRNTEPTQLQNRNPDVPGAFAALVHRMLAKDPAQRFASATEVVAALSPWCQDWGCEPVEQQGDATFLEGVRSALSQWPQGEQGQESTVDSLLFKTETEPVLTKLPLPFLENLDAVQRKLGCIAVGIALAVFGLVLLSALLARLW